MSKKIEMITVYVENMGSGKMSVADSFLSVRDFPNRKEGQQAVGIFATPVEMPKSHLKAFNDVLDAHYPHQANILSVEEYKAARKEALSVKPEVQEDSGAKAETKDNPDAEAVKKQLFDAAMNGGDEELLAYWNAYPAKDDEHHAEIQERSAYIDARAKDTQEVYESFLKEYPEGIYAADVKNILETN